MADDLFNIAQEVSKNAYAPYSHYKVGAVVKATSGKIYKGVNVENASYSNVQCAESNAISAMITGGDQKIAEILIYPSTGKHGEMCTPCGGCRQKIVEFADENTKIHYCSNDKIVKTVHAEEMLPDFFGPSKL